MAAAAQRGGALPHGAASAALNTKLERERERTSKKWSDDGYDDEDPYDLLGGWGGSSPQPMSKCKHEGLPQLHGRR